MLYGNGWFWWIKSFSTSFPSKQYRLLNGSQNSWSPSLPFGCVVVYVRGIPRVCSLVSLSILCVSSDRKCPRRAHQDEYSSTCFCDTKRIVCLYSTLILIEFQKCGFTSEKMEKHAFLFCSMSNLEPVAFLPRLRKCHPSCFNSIC